MLAIVEAARHKNASLGISGFLLWKGGVVVQALLGPQTAVDTLYATISKDARHHGAARLYSEAEAHDRFPDWSMQFWNLDKDTVTQAERNIITAAFAPHQRTIIFAGLHL